MFKNSWRRQNYLLCKSLGCNIQMCKRKADTAFWACFLSLFLSTGVSLSTETSQTLFSLNPCCLKNANKKLSIWYGRTVINYDFWTSLFSRDIIIITDCFKCDTSAETFFSLWTSHMLFRWIFPVYFVYLFQNPNTNITTNFSPTILSALNPNHTLLCP